MLVGFQDGQRGTCTVLSVNGHALVTGAAGFIGSHLCERLLSEGWLVTGVDSLAPTYETGRRRVLADKLQTRNSSFYFIEGDLLRIELGELLEDVDAIFHLAARPGVRSSWEDFQWSLQANVMATMKLLYAMAQTETPARLVFASSSSVYGAAATFPTSETELLRPISPYGVTKASAEQLVTAYINQYGMDAVTLRYFTVYGPRQRPDMAFTRWIHAALHGRPIAIFGDGSAVRDFTYVGDVVSATIGALNVPADTYNIAGGSPASVREAIDIIAELTNTTPELRNHSVAKGDPARTGGDVSRIMSVSDWKPETDLKDGLKRQVEWLSPV